MDSYEGFLFDVAGHGGLNAGHSGLGAGHDGRSVGHGVVNVGHDTAAPRARTETYGRSRRFSMSW